MPKDRSPRPPWGRATLPKALDPGSKSGAGKARDRRRYVLFTRWRRRRFFALLEESSNVRVACALSGVGLGCIYRLRRVEPGFSERMAVAKDRASARLRAKEAAQRGHCDSPSPNLSPDGERDSGLVIRRGIGGRLRVMAVGRRWWQERHDPVFLGHLAATGNVGASARAVGFTKKVAYDRRKARPDFAAAWDKALELAEMHLNGRLIAEAHRGLVAIDEEAFDAADAEPFDPWLAIRLCQIWEKKREKRQTRGTRD